MVSLDYFIDIKSFRWHYGPGVDSASNRNEYQEHFLWGKGGRCVRLTTLLPCCAVVMKSGNLNVLEPSGPLKACRGTASPLPIHTGLDQNRLYPNNFSSRQIFVSNPALILPVILSTFVATQFMLYTSIHIWKFTNNDVKFWNVPFPLCVIIKS
jgi:hypothetical protein